MNDRELSIVPRLRRVRCAAQTAARCSNRFCPTTLSRGCFSRIGAGCFVKWKLWNAFTPRRSFQLEPSGKTSVKGINTYRYSIPHSVFNTSAPGERGYHIDNEPDGILNIPCQPGTHCSSERKYKKRSGRNYRIGLPVVYSAPHFSWCSPEQKDSVTIMHPAEPKPSTGHWDYMQSIGYPMALTFNQQINIPFQNQKHFRLDHDCAHTLPFSYSFYSYMRLIEPQNISGAPVYVPITWIGEAVVIDEHTAAFIRNNLQVKDDFEESHKSISCSSCHNWLLSPSTSLLPFVHSSRFCRWCGLRSPMLITEARRL